MTSMALNKMLMGYKRKGEQEYQNKMIAMVQTKFIFQEIFW